MTFTPGRRANSPRDGGAIGFNECMTRALLVAAAAAVLLAASASPAAAPAAQIASVALDGSDVRVLSGSEPATSPLVARDGRILFFRSPAPYDLWVMNADGSGARRLTDGPEGYGPTAWSPTGGAFATTGWDVSPCGNSSRNCAIAEIRVHDPASGEIRARLRSRFRGAYAYSWSPDGRRIASIGELDQDLSGYTVEIANTNGTGRRVLVRTRFPNWLSEIGWSPRGDRIAYVQRGWIWLVRPGGGKPERVAKGRRPLWSPRGQLLYSVGGERRLLDPATKRSRLLFNAPADVAAAWAPDGMRLVYREGYVDDATTLTVVRASDGRIVSRLRIAGDVTTVSFAPGGSRLVYGVRFA
jgi:Tol biopolymer transport system component